MRSKNFGTPRKWLIGATSLIGIGGACAQYLDYALAVLPEPYRKLLPLVTVGAFICALFVAATVEDGADPEPSIVIVHEHVYTDEDERGNAHREDYLILRNVGNFNLTKVTILSTSVLDVSIKPQEAIPVLRPGGDEARVELYGLSPALQKISRIMYKIPHAVRPRLLLIKATVQCLDWKQREGYSLDYALIVHSSADIEVRRVHSGESTQWTDFDSLVQSAK